MKIEQNVLEKFISESLIELLDEQMGPEDTGNVTNSAQEQVGVLNQKLQDALSSNEELQARFSELEGMVAAKDAEMANIKTENEKLKQQLSTKEGPPTTPAEDTKPVANLANNLPESFTMSKAKLEEIIKEEMLFAKKQGIL